MHIPPPQRRKKLKNPPSPIRELTKPAMWRWVQATHRIVRIELGEAGVRDEGGQRPPWAAPGVGEGGAGGRSPSPEVAVLQRGTDPVTSLVHVAKTGVFKRDSRAKNKSLKTRPDEAQSLWLITVNLMKMSCP